MQAMASAVALVVLVTLVNTAVLAPQENDRDVISLLCPPFFSKTEGKCHPDPVFAEEINAVRRRRQATPATCPYCAEGVWDLYPNWNNCSLFYLCLNGNTVELNCQKLGAQFFNPTKRQCETVSTSSNTCLFRTVNI